MALFNLGKKKEGPAAPACCCGNGNEEAKTGQQVPCDCNRQVGGISRVRVLGAGCKSCQALLEATRKAVADMGLRIEVEYVTDMEKIAEFGIMRMPAIVVNEQVASMGKVLKAAEVEELLRNFPV